MSQKTVIIRGAFFLTAAGVIGRIIGFFYRIFLSRIIGAEGLGIYQLVFPLYALTYSITVSGIQTSISRFVSAKTASGDKRGAVRIFETGLIISLTLSLLTSLLLGSFHQWLAIRFVQEERASDLLRLLAYSVPFGSIHACINGYYFGLKQTKIPSVIQILENLLRFLSVLLLHSIWTEKGIPITPSIAVYGIVIEEFVAALFSATALSLHLSRYPVTGQAFHSRLFYGKQLLTTATPLTLNRILVNLLQSLEALLIPIQLKAFGMNTSDALSLYGILTGMAMPLILFPTAITSSVSTMLLPVISEAQAKKNRGQIIRTFHKTCGFFLFLGIFCWLFFFLFGGFAGDLLFQNQTAGTFIRTLSWLCPLLYLNPALASILNGLGKTGNVFVYNTIAILARICFVIFAIPKVGILGCFWGLMAAQVLMTLLYGITLLKI